MNVTREVVTDLWPVYAAGEASADTRALVEEYLKDDPEFAALLQESGEESFFDRLGTLMLPPLPPDHEASTLRRAKAELLGYNWFFFAAMLFSALAFGRIVSDTSWDVSPRNFIITATIAGCFWIAFFVRTTWMRRKVYRTTINGSG
jgi:hypothetical protein